MIGLLTLCFLFSFGLSCERITCSDVFDPICSLTIAEGSKNATVVYQNICKYNKALCEMGERKANTSLVPLEICNIILNETESRRIQDFSIIGAQQSCNHSCPTYCIDTYDPVCAQIRWNNESNENQWRVLQKAMINHCHADLFSCATGLNVTIILKNNCYQDSTQVLFQSQVNAIYGLKLFSNDVIDDDEPNSDSTRRYIKSVVTNEENDMDLENFIDDLVDKGVAYFREHLARRRKANKLLS